MVADNRQPGFRSAVHPKAKFYRLDIRDRGALDYLMAGGENNGFNLGSGVGFTVQEVVDLARQVTGQAIAQLTAGSQD